MLPLLQQGGAVSPQQQMARLKQQRLKRDIAARLSAARLSKVARVSTSIGGQSTLPRPATTGTVNAYPWRQALSQSRWGAANPTAASELTGRESPAAPQRQPLSQPRPRSVATLTTATRTNQRAATLAARPSFGSKAGKTLVLSPELAKYRELVRGMFSLEIPCVKCAAQFAKMSRCKACSGTGKQLPEPELLLWRWPHNHKAWGKVIAKMGKGWAAALPHEDWIGFKKVNNHGSTVLRVGGANLLHNKRLLFEHLLAAGDAVAPYIPETYCTHAEFIDATGRPSPDTTNEGGGPVSTVCLPLLVIRGSILTDCL